ncbi:MAG: flagellar basal body-associated protein FliL [Alistipes senegalensis]|nr:flagellar basal body-associated protein FliL [Oxalobacter formigenes]MCM1281487.1 flagellar basal body-associated protein FliL [Alistipes senegalensis]
MAANKEAAEGAEEGAKKKGKGKLIIILAVVLVLILGGAGGGWYWWSHQNADEVAADDDDGDSMPVKKKKKKKKKKEEGEEEKAPVFVSLDAFTVNLQGEEGQLLQTAITLQMVDDEDATKLKQHLPLIRSRLLMLLSSKHPQEVLTAEGKTKLAEEIAAQIRQPFLPGDYPLEIVNVLFTSFIVQ